MAAALIGLGVWFFSADEPEQPTGPGLLFGDDDQPAEDRAVPDEIDFQLVTRLELPVVVIEGDGPRSDRIVVEPAEDLLPQPIGAVVAAIARSGSEGRVVLTGPPGWFRGVCVQATVTTAELRPLDAVLWSEGNECAEVESGRLASVRCLGERTIVLAIDVPQEEVELVEGGTAFADAIRVQVIGSAEGYETTSVRGTIEVAGDSAVRIPTLQGPPGSAAEFLLGGAGATASCAFQ